MKCRSKRLNQSQEQKIRSLDSKVANTTIKRCWKLRRRSINLLFKGKRQRKSSFSSNVDRKIYNFRKTIFILTVRRKKTGYRIKGRLLYRRKVISKRWNSNRRGCMPSKSRSLHQNLLVWNRICFRGNRLLISRKKK